MSVKHALGYTLCLLTLLFSTSNADVQNFNLSELHTQEPTLLGGLVFGQSENDLFGYHVAEAGDINGDGFDDFLIGAPADSDNVEGDPAGAVYVVYGGATLSMVPFNAGILSGVNGLIVKAEQKNDYLGTSSAVIDDIDANNVNEVAIGASRQQNFDKGGAYFLYGVTGEQQIDSPIDLRQVTGLAEVFTVRGEVGNERLGISMSSGDTNGDGVDELYLGAHEPSGAINTGKVYVIYNEGVAQGDEFSTSDLDFNETGFVINGVDLEGLTGYSIDVSGDYNGDGIDDIVIGAPQAEVESKSQAGIVYVIYGSGEPDYFSDTVELSDLNLKGKIAGYKIYGSSAGDETGFSVANAGDVNDDGIDDLLIGAPTSAVNNAPGKAYLIYGTESNHGGELNLSDLIVTQGMKINGVEDEDNTGGSVASAGDFNGDCVADFIISSSQANHNEVTAAGVSHIIFGSSKVGYFPSTLDLSSESLLVDGVRINGANSGELSGHDVAYAGDVNGDGFADVLIGATGLKNAEDQLSGGAYWLYGWEEEKEENSEVIFQNGFERICMLQVK